MKREGGDNSSMQNLERESPSTNEFLVTNHPYIPLASKYQNALCLNRVYIDTGNRPFFH